MVLHFEEYDPEDVLDAVDSLEDQLDVEKYIGVIFENNFTMLEFKAQMYLILGDTKEALASLEFGTNKLGYIVAELIRMDEEKLVWEEYEEALFNIFGRERVEKALQIVKGEALFINTTFHKDYHNMLKMFDRLEPKKQEALFSANKL